MFSKEQIHSNKNVVSHAKITSNGNVVIGDTIITNIFNNTDYEQLCEQEKELIEDIQLLIAIEYNEKAKNKLDKKQNTLSHILNQKQSFEQYIIKLAFKLCNTFIDETKQQTVNQLFKEGRYDEIEKVLNIDDLKQEQIKLLKATELRRKELEELETNRQKNANTYLILANLTAIKFNSLTRFEDTCKCYEEAITSYECASNYFQYATFLYSDFQFQKARDIYSLLINKYFEEIDNKLKASILNDFANVLRNFREYEEAENAFKQAIEIREELTLQNPELYEFDLASSYNNLGVLKKHINDLAGSKYFQQKSVEIRKKILENTDNNNIDDRITNKSYYSDTLLNLANVQVSLLEWKEAEELLYIAKEIRSELNKEIKTDKVLLQITNLYGQYMIFNSLGILYWSKREFEKSKYYYTEANELLNELLKLNRLKYLRHKGELYSNLSLLESEMNNYQEAKKVSLFSLEVYEELTALNEKIYKPDLAIAYNNVGAIAKQHKDLDYAEECLIKALEIRRNLVKTHSKAYNLNVSNTLNSLGLTYFLKEDFGKSEVCYREALLLRQQLVGEGNKQLELELAVTLNDLGMLLVNKDKIEGYIEARGFLERALEIRQQLVDKDKKAFLHFFKETQVNMSIVIYRLNNNIEDLLKNFEEILENAELELEPFICEKLRNVINETLKELKIDKQL